MKTIRTKRWSVGQLINAMSEALRKWLRRKATVRMMKKPVNEDHNEAISVTMATEANHM
jgi:hypothetical protein